MRLRGVVGFPDPVNEKAARVVAAGVLVLGVVILVTRQGWLLVPLAYGFWARVLTGPTMSPLGQLATRVVAPRLGAPNPVPGSPKRFAQGMGLVFTTSALVLWFAGLQLAALALIGLLVVAAFLESVLAYCLGCVVFALLMRVGIIPSTVCERCANLSVTPAPRS